MIRLNGNTKSSSYSTMCARRDKGMLQTSIILILVVALGYGYYLHSLSQVKIKYLDMKALRLQSQEQSLSSQLQSAYEANAKSEKAVHDSKKQYRNLQEEKEALIQEMLIEHQDKDEEMEKQNKELKVKNQQLSSDNQDLKSKHARVYKDHEDLKKDHQKAISNHAKAVNEAHEQLEEYRIKNEAILRLQKDLEQQILEANGDYQSLQDALKAVPADAVDFNHPVVQRLDTKVKQMIIGHLGEKRDDLVHVLPTQRQGDGLQEEENMTHERRVVSDVPARQEEMGQLFPGAKTVDICALRVEQGPCQSDEIRFAYHLGLNECRGFMYSGCGGNQNNFMTIDECKNVCNDPSKRYTAKQSSEEEELSLLQQEGDIESNALPSDQQPHGHAAQEVQQTAVQLQPQEPNGDLEFDMKQHAENKDYDLPEEELATQEIDQAGNEGQKDVEIDSRMDEDLLKTSKEGMQLQDDEDNRFKAEITNAATDKGHKEEPTSDYSEEEEQNNVKDGGFAKQEKRGQVLLPPAIQVTEREPDSNVQPAQGEKIDFKDVNGREWVQEEQEPGIEEKAALEMEEQDYDMDQNAGLQDGDNFDAKLKVDY